MNVAFLNKLFCFFLILTGSFITTQAQEKSNFHFTFNHMALSVKDAGESVAFYTKVLGLTEITNRTKKEGIRWMSMGEDKELHLISTIHEPYHINKAIHLSFTTPNFDLFVQHLAALKIPYSNWEGTPQSTTTRADGVKQVYFQDIDGYWIEVNNIGQK